LVGSWGTISYYINVNRKYGIHWISDYRLRISVGSDSSHPGIPKPQIDIEGNLCCQVLHFTVPIRGFSLSYFSSQARAYKGAHQTGLHISRVGCSFFTIDSFYTELGSYKNILCNFFAKRLGRKGYYPYLYINKKNKRYEKI
jgi:hypothetical protein